MSRTRAGCSRVTHPSAGRRQVCCHTRAAPRLACVKPAASVHPEPGSNSSLYILSYFSCPSRHSELTLLLACLPVFSMNLLLHSPFRFRKGLQRYAFFLSCQIFLSFFCKEIVSKFPTETVQNRFSLVQQDFTAHVIPVRLRRISAAGWWR